ncbi:hypothetical protein G4D82_05180 [Flavobacterium sp. CYK-4]|uniref:hypothetical protein n=1 Tax=Flavobacterium lotistagni TaxID=2709660 RepID=UPI00140C4A15|nr:hypothetical protein [Flavobacterium lotistagni]NHM06605.1 hypothetical protein [Flavobacterium lotistagni]
MKKLVLVLVVLSLASCQCKKASVQATAATLSSECPKDGTCKIEIIQNKRMLVKQDEFGSLFYTLEENSSKNVVKYVYNRTVKGDIQDANYREEVVFELDNNNKTTNAVDASLQNHQLLFGRFCFCRGQTGYYKINQGNLSVNNNKIELNFKTDQVPQIIKKVAFDLK